MTDAPPVADDGLTPAQRDTLAQLGSRPQDRPSFAPDLRDRLRAALEDEAAAAAALVPADEVLFVSKHALATVHQCEARWRAEALDRGFAASVASVAGSVTHKAVELTLNRRSPATPAELVDAALGRLTDSDQWMSDWLRTCDEDDRAEVRGAAVERVTSFTEVWPPLQPAWRPVTEQRLRADLAGGRIVLSGRADLTLGRAEGLRAGKVVVDFKTGTAAIHHRDDLRFYALIETLRLGVPPRALATSYLDSARLHVELVTEDLLDAAAARTADGVTRMAATLHGHVEPARRPSGACRWCVEREVCPPGIEHLESRDR